MPHITVKGIPKKKVGEMANDLKEIMINVTDSKKEHLKIFYSPVERIDAPDQPAIEVYWMHRAQKTCDNVSAALTEYLKKQGYSFVQITFNEFPGNLFYENGVHY